MEPRRGIRLCRRQRRFDRLVRFGLGIHADLFLVFLGRCVRFSALGIIRRSLLVVGFGALGVGFTAFGVRFIACVGFTALFVRTSFFIFGRRFDLYGRFVGQGIAAGRDYQVPFFDSAQNLHDFFVANSGLHNLLISLFVTASHEDYFPGVRFENRGSR